MSLIPTWLIGIWRVSARLCTSSTETMRAWGAAAWFMRSPGECEELEARTVCGLSRRDQPLGGDKAAQLRSQSADCGVLCPRGFHLRGRLMFPPAPHRRFETRLIELCLREAFVARAVFDEAIGNAERQRGQRLRAPREQFEYRGAGDRILFDGHEAGVRACQTHDELFVEWFDEAHVHDGGIETLADHFRSLDHGAKREDQESAGTRAPHLRFADGQRRHLFHRRNARALTSGVPHGSRASDGGRG